MPSAERIRVVIIGAGARGNRVFASLMSHHDTGFVVSGVVEPVPEKREAFQHQYGVPDEQALETLDQLLERPRFADIAFICTLDPTHYQICMALSESGYDVLLEKPIATTLQECYALLEAERRCRNQIFVAHVLRHAPFFQRLKAIIDSGEFGTVRHLALAEHVGHWHFAHSYVRGNWRRAEQSGPIILTKCSHDMDIIPWLVNREVVSVASTGALSFFVEKNAPPGAPDRCIECSQVHDCHYSARRFYVNEKAGWPFDTIVTPPDSLERRWQAIAQGPYGRCVWRCDNDVCDHQVVVLGFEGGLLGTFEMRGLTADNTRRITVLLDQAEITGDLFANRLRVSRFTGQPHEVEVEEPSLPDMHDRHGGGDLGLLRALRQHLIDGRRAEFQSSLQRSILSHTIAFLAEESRASGGVQLPISDVLRLEPPDDAEVDTSLWPPEHDPLQSID